VAGGIAVVALLVAGFFATRDGATDDGDDSATDEVATEDSPPQQPDAEELPRGVEEAISDLRFTEESSPMCRRTALPH
jgi:FtsZ-interacting cell division protein ZipA